MGFVASSKKTVSEVLKRLKDEDIEVSTFEMKSRSTKDGDGAFSPERAGAVPSGALIKMCFSGEYTEKEVYKKIVGNGGFNAYLGTNDMRDVAKMIADGDAHADEVREAFILQVCKNIGSMACVLKGKVDRIIVTGGIAYNKEVVDKMEERASRCI